MTSIFHIVVYSDWQAQQNADYYQADSLATEGFIHCSDQHQTDGVVERYYANVPQLILLEINPALLEAELKYELAPSGEEFPHVFGKINRSAIINITSFERKKD